MVAAGFERDIDSGATRLLASRQKGVDFGMLTAGPHMPTLTNDQSVANDDAADTGIRRGRVKAAFGKPERARHEFVVGCAERSGHQCPSGCGESDTSLMTLENSSTSSKFR